VTQQSLIVEQISLPRLATCICSQRSG